jgi:hypothetical protein
MNQMRLTKLAIAGSAIACTALLSFGWSEQRGVSLSVESAQARVGRPLTHVSVAGVARRQDRRAAYGYGAGVAGAAAVGTAAAVAATSPNWGWGGGPYYTGTNYYTGGPYYTGAAYPTGGQALGANAYYAAPAANPSSGWYITPNGMACTSGTLILGANGLPFLCP